MFGLRQRTGKKRLAYMLARMEFKQRLGLNRPCQFRLDASHHEFFAQHHQRVEAEANAQWHGPKFREQPMHV